MKKAYIIIFILVTLVCAGFYVMNTQEKNSNTPITTDRAIALVKEKYPQYKDYPSDNLPPKRIEVVETENGWRVGMYIEGSGVAGILRADCLFVTSSGEVIETGLFQGEGPATSINLTTCVPKE